MARRGYANSVGKPQKSNMHNELEIDTGHIKEKQNEKSENGPSLLYSLHVNIFVRFFSSLCVFFFVLF